MTDMFEEEDEDLIEGDLFVNTDDDADIDLRNEKNEEDEQNIAVDARRRLEDMLEEKRLRDELDDFGDY